MAAINTVRATLLNFLFRKPTPLKPKEFKAAIPHLFPDTSLFMEFLRTTNYQELERISKRIVLRLGFCRPTPPPSRLMFNLLGFEYRVSSREGQKRLDFAPQDHFVHLVHLYLLGIYIFAYHHAIHQSCATEINRFKRIHGAQNSDLDDRVRIRDVSIYETFGSLWSTFVLYHDLGYPLETISPESRLKNGVLAEHLVPFRKIKKSQIKEIALRALSRLSATQMAVGDEEQPTLGDMFVERAAVCFESDGTRHKLPRASDSRDTHEKSAIAELMNSVKAAVFLRDVDGIQTHRLVASILPDSHYFAMLEDTVFAKPIVLLSKKSAGYWPIWFINPRALPRDIPQGSAALHHAAFVSGITFSSNYAWRYFALGPKTRVDELVQKILEAEAASFRALIKEIEAHGFREQLLGQIDSAEELAWSLYHHFGALLDYFGQQDEDPFLPHAAAVLVAFRSAAKKLPKLAATVVEKILESAVQEKKIDPYPIILGGKNEGEIAAELSEMILAKLKEGRGLRRTLLAAELAPSIKKQIMDSVELERNLRRCFQKIRGSLVQFLGPEEESIVWKSDLEVAEADANLVLAFSRLVSESKELNSQLAVTKLSSITDVARTYRSEWQKDGQIDHGLGSTVAFLECSHWYFEFLRAMGQQVNADADPHVQIFRLAFGTNTPEGERRLASNLNIEMGLGAAAIAVHNLSPKYFNDDKKSYRTDLRRCPFAFLAMLADGLQRWDRKRLVDLSKRDPDGLIPGSDFDLRVTPNSIILRYRARRMDHKAEVDRFREQFKEYLIGATAILELELIEGS